MDTQYSGILVGKQASLLWHIYFIDLLMQWKPTSDNVPNKITNFNNTVDGTELAQSQVT